MAKVSVSLRVRIAKQNRKGNYFKFQSQAAVENHTFVIANQSHWAAGQYIMSDMSVDTLYQFKYTCVDFLALPVAL